MKDKNQMMMMGEREGKEDWMYPNRAFLLLMMPTEIKFFFFFFSGSYRREKNLIMMQLVVVRCILSYSYFKCLLINKHVLPIFSSSLFCHPFLL
jgi:hypothetical protein